MNYRKIYDSIIERAVQRGSKRESGKNQDHHIYPACLGGLKIPDNMVYLYHREHLFAHLLLVKIYPQSKGLLGAATLMSKRGALKSRTYAWLKERQTLMQIGKKRGSWYNDGVRNFLLFLDDARIVNLKKGQIRRLTEDQRNGISLRNKGRKMPQEAVERSRKGNIGQKRTPEILLKFSQVQSNRSLEWRENQSRAMKGKKLPEKHKEKLRAAKQKAKGRLCEYCGKPWHPCWHGERCREESTRENICKV